MSKRTKPGDDWATWSGDYDKEWYDVRLPDGTVIPHCWPNAGVMMAMDASGRSFRPGTVEARYSPTHPADGLPQREKPWRKL